MLSSSARIINNSAFPLALSMEGGDKDENNLLDLGCESKLISTGLCAFVLPHFLNYDSFLYLVLFQVYCIANSNCWFESISEVIILLFSVQ